MNFLFLLLIINVSWCRSYCSKSLTRKGQFGSIGVTIKYGDNDQTELATLVDDVLFENSKAADCPSKCYLTDCSEYYGKYRGDKVAIDPSKHTLRMKDKVTNGYNETFCVACSNSKVNGVIETVTNQVTVTQSPPTWLHALGEAQHQMKAYLHAGTKGVRETQTLQQCQETCQTWMRKCCARYVVDVQKKVKVPLDQFTCMYKSIIDKDYRLDIQNLGFSL